MLDYICMKFLLDLFVVLLMLLIGLSRINKTYIYVHVGLHFMKFLLTLLCCYYHLWVQAKLPYTVCPYWITFVWSFFLTYIIIVSNSIQTKKFHIQYIHIGLHLYGILLFVLLFWIYNIIFIKDKKVIRYIIYPL